MLLVAKKEALGRVETEGAKFVEMSDLFAHESLCVITTLWLGTPKTFPKISQNFGKTFLPYWEHKGNELVKNGGACIRNQDRTTQSGSAER
jgi:hypothetical protein